MKILFCVPAYGSQVRVETMMTVASGVIHMIQNVPGAEVEMFSIDMAEIARVRNIFASVAMKKEVDALIMLDSDMSLPGETFSRLVVSPHEVCGVTYPKREIDLARFHLLAKNGADLNAATQGALNFISANAFIHDKGNIEVKDSFLEMTDMPGGCLMIRRSALDTLWKRMPSIRQTDEIGDMEASLGLTRVIRCFDNFQNGNLKLSEDYSFCRRWREVGGRIHALFDVSVAHYGHMKFEGKFSDNLMARARNVRPIGEIQPRGS